LLLYSNGKWRALYDLRADPNERRNVIEEMPDIAASMVGVFRQFAQQQRKPPLSFIDPNVAPVPVPRRTGEQLSPEMEKQLRALGYL
jgi:hypothetical protein